MNNKFYTGTSPAFPGAQGATVFNGTVNPVNPPIINMNNNNEIPFEQSYIENILRLNKGKKVEVYMSFADSIEWRDRRFEGIIEESGRDHIILSDPASGNWYLLLMIYVDYIRFNEKINYNL